MSENTMVMGEDGKKVKKKRSTFGWLKKAFALSEEEKAAFEQRRRGAGEDRGYGYADAERERYEERSRPRWVDGKRVR